MGRISAKACVVTGAGSGIGKAIAERFALEGGQVVCVDINAAAVQATVQGIQAAGGQGEAITADVSQPVAVDGFVQRCVDLYGRIDILVNNAGINVPGVFHEVTNEAIDRMLDVNLKGYIYASRAAIPHMLKQHSGAIVNMSSVNGLVAEPFLSLYAASKGAIVMLTKGIALDYAQQGIRCNCICPGWVDTPINYAHAEMLGGLDKIYAEIDRFQPIGRPGEPSEIANLALFLASDEASFMTGSIIAADGGMTAQ
jgi:NAD(P)-dependent dehydrogenase (short-subunit alcohol dehydrogenase family)